MIVGVDFGAPKRAVQQRRKIIAMAAHLAGKRAYRIDASGLNAQLFKRVAPGWSAQELAAVLLTHPARVVGFDFPFSLPQSLLGAPHFALSAGQADGAFRTWRRFNTWVARRLPLTDPVDYSPFIEWRNPAARAQLWAKRATDLATGAQPPLKDRFQATFQMTLLGNAVLAKLEASKRYRVVPFSKSARPGEVIEIYPGATLRRLGLARYKAHPEAAVRLGLAACAAAGIALEVDRRIVALACNYNSGTAESPDHDVADAFIALCTAILYAEGLCHPTPQAPHEGTIWVPT
jgi:predicted nuclease with RNAse H fold